MSGRRVLRSSASGACTRSATETLLSGARRQRGAKPPEKQAFQICSALALLAGVTRSSSTPSASWFGRSRAAPTAHHSPTVGRPNAGADRKLRRERYCPRRRERRHAPRRSSRRLDALPSPRKVAGVERLHLVDADAAPSCAVKMLVESEIRKSDEGGRPLRNPGLKGRHSIQPANLVREDRAVVVVRRVPQRGEPSLT